MQINVESDLHKRRLKSEPYPSLEDEISPVFLHLSIEHIFNTISLQYIAIFMLYLFAYSTPDYIRKGELGNW